MLRNSNFVLLSKEKSCIPSITSDCMISIRDYSKIVAFTNLSCFTEHEENLDIPEYLTYDTAHCNLPNNRFFCYGNAGGAQVSGFAFIINENKTIQALPPGIPCVGSKCVFYQGSIYSFCGFTSRLIPILQKFDLIKNRWENCTDPLHRNSVFSCVDFYDMVLYSDIDGCLYLYDIATNSHSIIMTMGESKLLLHFNERAFFVENKTMIYESKTKNPFDWQFLCRTDVYAYSREYSFFGSSIYYKPEKNFICKFDLNTKTSRTIKIKMNQ